MMSNISRFGLQALGNAIVSSNIFNAFLYFSKQTIASRNTSKGVVSNKHEIDCYVDGSYISSQHGKPTYSTCDYGYGDLITSMVKHFSSIIYTSLLQVREMQ